ncbi:Clp protease N-terminal domain-containing protein [Streptomyces pathocidini]|uniref:Clp protease N-terminal domain-containing protein n=1 Tax=Streptomyces pathocidini TaxID=1650571 RepID=A0ABW7UXU4_9ACTN|nr:Clp protease N-terminal domain-containing protein [Streptomyces pathocidini]
MQNRTPPPGFTGPADPGADARLSAELASVVSGARRRAVRDADRQIDTAHLLHGLLEADPAVHTAFESGAQVVRLFGYLAQRSIGYGLQWHGKVEDSGAVPLVRGVREEGERGGELSRMPGWSPTAEGALESAWERARARGAECAEGLDLLAALVADPECRAAEVLQRAGVDRELLSVRLDGPPPPEPARQASPPVRGHSG